MNKALLFVAAVLAFSTALWAEGGETCEDATVIPSFEFTYCDQGTTVGHVSDYSPWCIGCPGPDVVYKYTTPFDMDLTISLCRSDYDTGLDCWVGGCP